MTGRSSKTTGIAFRVPNEKHKKIHEIAQAKGISFSDLLRGWVEHCYQVETEQQPQKH